MYCCHVVLSVIYRKRTTKWMNEDEKMERHGEQEIKWAGDELTATTTTTTTTIERERDRTKTETWTMSTITFLPFRLYLIITVMHGDKKKLITQVNLYFVSCTIFIYTKQTTHVKNYICSKSTLRQPPFRLETPTPSPAVVLCTAVQIHSG